MENKSFLKETDDLKKINCRSKKKQSFLKKSKGFLKKNNSFLQETDDFLRKSIVLCKKINCFL